MFKRHFFKDWQFSSKKDFWIDKFNEKCERIKLKKNQKRWIFLAFDILICRIYDLIMRNMIGYDWIWFNMIKDKRARLWKRHFIQAK
jgi:hypothetical protein